MVSPPNGRDSGTGVQNAGAAAPAPASRGDYGPVPSLPGAQAPAPPAAPAPAQLSPGWFDARDYGPASGGPPTAPLPATWPAFPCGSDASCR